MDLEQRYRALEQQFAALVQQKRDLQDQLTQTQGNIDATYGALQLLQDLMGEQEEEGELDDQAGGSGPDKQE